MQESGRVPGKGNIRASVEKLSERVPERGRNSVTTLKSEEFGRVPGKGRVRASIDELSGRVPKNGRISVSTRKW